MMGIGSMRYVRTWKPGAYGSAVGLCVQGKSQRRLQYMHALHLVVLRHKMRAAKAVSQKLGGFKGLSRLGSSPRALPSPGRRLSLKAPLDIKPATVAEDV